MTSRERISFFIIILAFSFAGCEYEPEGINFQIVDSTAIPTLKIGLDQIGDTLVVGTWTDINFKLAFSKSVNFTMNILVGNTVVYSGTQHTGTFTIPAYDFSNGFYPLIFEVTSNSGTLSLADRLELEKVLFQFQGKVIQIETSPAQKLEIISVTRQDDGMLITWPKYPKANFTRYILHKTVTPITRGSLDFYQYEITDIRQTSLVDHYFVGGNVEYTLQVMTITDMAFSETYRLEVLPSVINKIQTVGLNTVEVGWTKSLFPNAFERYHLLEDDAYGSGDYFMTTNVDDTITTISDFPFGAEVKAELRTQPKDYPPASELAATGTYSTFADIYLGDKIPSGIKVLEVKSADRLYYYHNGYLYAMLHSETKPYDSIQMNLNISTYAGNNNKAVAQSPDGQYFYVSSGRNLVRLNAETLDEISSISLGDVFLDPDAYPFTIAVNNDNRLIIDVRRQAANSGTVYFSSFIAIMDGGTATVSDTIRNYSDVISMHTSEDQRYVYVNTFYENKIFEISSGGVELRRATVSEDAITTAVFTPSEIHVIDNSTSTVFALSDFTQTASSSHPLFMYRPTIDPFTGNLGVLTGELEYSIYDPLSMNLLHAIKLKRNSNDTDDFIQVMNHQLISTGGFRLALP